MGLGIKARATHRKSSWRNHLKLSKEFYRRNLKGEHGSILIIGSGRLYDFPSEVFRQCSSVTLLDADPLSIWTNRLRFIFNKNVSCICADISDWIPAGDTFFDVVISLNLLSQIPLYHRDAMSDEFLATSEGLVSYQALRKRLQLVHLSFLARVAKRSLLTFDREFFSYENSVARWDEETALDPEVSDMLRSHLLETWLWHVSPSPDGAIHRIGAASMKNQQAAS